jgi:hypothetical protein
MGIFVHSKTGGFPTFLISPHNVLKSIIQHRPAQSYLHVKYLTDPDMSLYTLSYQKSPGFVSEDAKPRSENPDLVNIFYVNTLYL